MSENSGPSSEELEQSAIANLANAVGIVTQVHAQNFGNIDVNAALGLSSISSAALQALALARIAKALELDENWKLQ